MASVDLSAGVRQHIQRRRADARTASGGATSRRLQWLAVLTSLTALVLVTITLMSEISSQPEPTIASGDSFSDWDVLVISVSEEEFDSGGKFTERLGNEGLQVQDLSGITDSVSERPDILLAPGELGEQIRRFVGTDSDDFSAELNPEIIGGLLRDDLMKEFVESMEEPTRSDRYFGEVRLVIPNGESLIFRNVSADQPIRDIMIAVRAESSESDLEHGEETRIAEYLKKGNGKPVLVVLLRKGQQIDNDQSSDVLPALFNHS